MSTLNEFYINENDYDQSILIHLMNELETIALNDDTFIKFAWNFVNNNRLEALKKIYFYGHNNFVFKDDENWEDIISPVQMLIKKTGDCDDFALWVKSICDVIGIKASYILFGKQPKEYSHIATISINDVIDLQKGVTNLYDYTRQTGYHYYKRII